MILDTTCSIESNFWSSDKAALNILIDRLEQSNKTNLAIQNFFSQRAQIELEYGNQLLKLSETFHTQDENFSVLSNTTEMSARAHMDLSDSIKNLLEIPLNDYFKEQETIKSLMANQMEESQNIKILHGDNVKKSRKLYIQECQKPNPSDKEIEILDYEYQKAIHLMQSNSHVWIHDWQESCKTFESLESNRLEYLKSVIKTFASMTACAYSIDDQTCERLLTVMDDIHVQEELSKFITNYGTGSTLPDIPKYTKYKRDERKQQTELVTIKEINIPTRHDEQLRSVNDQLKKIPSPWDTKKKSLPPLQYPLNPLYKTSSKSKSDPILSNLTFTDDKSYNKNKSTLLTSYEETSDYEPHHFLPTPTKKVSLLFSPLGFLKKKKEKRLSLLPITTTTTTTTTTKIPNNRSSSVLTPPSPLFSQMDFYYSPSDHHRNLPSDIY